MQYREKTVFQKWTEIKVFSDYKFELVHYHSYYQPELAKGRIIQTAMKATMTQSHAKPQHWGKDTEKHVHYHWSLVLTLLLTAELEIMNP